LLLSEEFDSLGVQGCHFVLHGGTGDASFDGINQPSDLTLGLLKVLSH